MNTNKYDLSYLGLEYQERLLSQILSDNNFAKNILNVLKPNYFSNDHLKLISQTIINTYSERDVVLDYGSLEIEIRDKFSSNKEEVNDALIQYVNKLRHSSKNDWEAIQNRALKFCKVQELAKIASEMTKEVTKGNIEDVLNYESKISEIMAIGTKNKNEIVSFDNIDELLLDDFRHPISTGIDGLDKDMNGGLSPGELAIVLAALGTGKTTLATILANSAFNQGKNVLQICFEDSTKEIQRKHMARWTGITINDLSNRRNEVKEIVREKTKGKSNKLVIVKMSSIDTTMRTIRNYVKDLKQQGIKIDLILIDYIDCVQPSRTFTDNNIAEGMIMREFENLLSEFDMAGYAMTQGNRCVRIDQKVEIENKGEIAIGNVREGDMILTHKGYKKVTHVFPREIQKTYKIRTKSGKEIIVSGKHKFPTKEKGNISINDGLKIGDKLFIK